MDLESKSSSREYVEENGLLGEVETIGDKLVSTCKDEKSIDLDKQLNSPVKTSSPPISKGFGLRKWRRLRRRDLVNDTSVNVENSKILKRVLSGSANSHAKQMHFLGPDVKQDSLGSVGSVNNSMVDSAIAASSHGTGLAFSAGMDSDNSEDRSSKSSTAASGTKVRYDWTVGRLWDKQRAEYLGGKNVVSSGDSGQQRKSSIDKSKKLRGERIKIEKENSHSSMESAESRSSNFVFMQGASFSLSSREQGGRRMMDYNEENSDHSAHTSNRKDKVGEEEVETEDYLQEDSVEESQIKNSSDNMDPLTEAFTSFRTLQEALKKELQKFQELGKVPISSLHDGREISSCIHAGHELDSEASASRRFGSENMGLTSLDLDILILVNNVEHLEIKLEETKCILEVKESQIHELESTLSVCNRGTEIGIEDIFQQKMEAEIEYLIYSRSVANLKRRIKLIEEEKTLAEKMVSKLGEAETKAENLKNEAQDLQKQCVEITEIQEVKSFKKRVYKSTSCLFLQLGLLFVLLNFQIMPEAETVMPT